MAPSINTPLDWAAAPRIFGSARAPFYRASGSSDSCSSTITPLELEAAARIFGRARSPVHRAGGIMSLLESLESSSPSAQSISNSHRIDSSINTPVDLDAVARIFGGDRASGSSGSVNILSLPNELLLQIFGYTFTGRNDFRKHYSNPNHPNLKQSDIKNCRRVCRRFHDVSSVLLIGSVTIDQRRSTLDRLNDISRHPLISKGVRAVRVHLRYLSDIRDDGPASVEPLSFDFGYKIAASGNRHKFGPGKLSTMLAFNRIHEALSNDTAVADKDLPYLLYLKMVTKKHRQLKEEQDILLRPGAFIQRAAPAILRMPWVRRLVIDDNPLPTTMELPDDQTELLEALCRREFTPRYLPSNNQSPGLIAIKLPAAIQASGGSLDDIDISLPHRGSGPRRFSLTVSGADSPQLSAYIHSFASAGTLNVLKLSFNHNISKPATPAALNLTTALLTSGLLKNLHTLSLGGTWIPLTALETFLADSPFLKFLYTHELAIIDDYSNTAWPEALEIIRRKHLTDVRFSFRYLDTSKEDWYVMWEKERLEYYYYTVVKRIRAEQYVLGMISYNPYFDYRISSLYKGRRRS
ncbi:hypothetical protein QBC34DRAFT_384534 [Podospora aff. communis PSN243]|uniref:F-box domain-containing protein n=1 Tax=Podospora aff. communis PSN243 TaxID=3040156 RepID=A0AAV9G8J8_9PEZI|nr:hypothetical protein QBC34DRAFT_384534 [Podospora aff. communis PSN243]